jgi:hypothetical protein
MARSAARRDITPGDSQIVTVEGHAPRPACVLACAGVLVVLAFRNSLWWIVGSRADVAGISQAYALLGLSALAIFVVVFAFESPRIRVTAELSRQDCAIARVTRSAWGGSPPGVPAMRGSEGRPGGGDVHEQVVGD